MNLAAADRTLLRRQLTDLSRAVEEMLLTGLTAASESTRQTLDVTFREASRLRLLRLASTLRGANEEIGRYVTQQNEFSAKRLSFFLNRAWMLGQGLLQAIQNNDDAALSRLLWTQPTRPVERLDVVTLGVGKKVAKGSFCAFEFRLRAISESNPSRLVWSCIFPLKADNEIPPEGFLQLPQKQKFKTSLFLEPKVLTITNAMIADDGHGCGRITLTDTTTVTAGDAFADWLRYATWSPEPLVQRLQSHEPGPLDLEIELQDEVVLSDWTIQAPLEGERDGQVVYPIISSHLQFDAVAPSGSDGTELRKQLDDLVKAKTRPPLYGLLHFDRARFILQPLALLTESGPTLITISSESINSKALLKTLKF
jgi:hypothetical protein